MRPVLLASAALLLAPGLAAAQQCASPPEAGAAQATTTAAPRPPAPRLPMGAAGAQSYGVPQASIVEVAAFWPPRKASYGKGRRLGAGGSRVGPSGVQGRRRAQILMPPAYRCRRRSGTGLYWRHRCRQ